jgi:hypothetical protein
MTENSDPRELAREAKAIVALAFRNGPIEDVHAGQPCAACTGKPGVSRISDDEMKLIMKNAVNKGLHCFASRAMIRMVTPARWRTASAAPPDGTSRNSGSGNKGRRHQSGPGQRRLMRIAGHRPPGCRAQAPDGRVAGHRARSPLRNAGGRSFLRTTIVTRSCAKCCGTTCGKVRYQGKLHNGRAPDVGRAT